MAAALGQDSSKRRRGGTLNTLSSLWVGSQAKPTRSRLMGCEGCLGLPKALKTSLARCPAARH